MKGTAKMELGKNIYSLRKEKGISKEKLAEKVNVTRETISNWELGEAFPNPEQLILLSHVFCKSIDELVGNDMQSTATEGSNDNIKTLNISNSISLILFESCVVSSIQYSQIFFFDYTIKRQKIQ